MIRIKYLFRHLPAVIFTTLFITCSASIALNLYLMRSIVFIAGGYTQEDRDQLQMIIDGMQDK